MTYPPSSSIFLFIAAIIGASDFEGSFRLLPPLATAARALLG